MHFKTLGSLIDPCLSLDLGILVCILMNFKTWHSFIDPWSTTVKRFSWLLVILSVMPVFFGSRYSFLYMNALLRHFKLSAVFFIVNNFNTDALLVHGSIVSGFNGSQYPIVCILMHAWSG